MTDKKDTWNNLKMSPEMIGDCDYCVYLNKELDEHPCDVCIPGAPEVSMQHWKYSGVTEKEVDERYIKEQEAEWTEN